MVCLDEAGRGRRTVRLVAAPANLTPWVEHFFFLVRTAPATEAWRVVPDASAHIIFSLVDGTPRCRLVGSRRSFCDIDISRRRITVGARLRPGALPELARCPANALTDRSLPIEDVFGRAGRSLSARMAAESPLAALRELERFLSSRLDRCEPDPRFETALQEAQSVEGAAAMLSMPLRTFRAHALQAIGLPPKLILRIRRLYRALRCGTVARPVWSDIASRSGYADQAHMVREFQSLVGDPPERWRRRAVADSFNTPPASCASLRK